MDSVIQAFKQAADKAYKHLQDEFAKLQTGVANPALVEGVMVDAYGQEQPLKAVASVSIPEPRVIKVQPWDKALLKPVEDAIRKADIGLSPVNSGDALMLNIPALTEERRRDLVKVVKKLAEEAKVVVRQARQDAHNKFKQMKNSDEMTEDDHRGAENKLQEAVDVENKRLDELAKHKEESVMTV